MSAPWIYLSNKDWIAAEEYTRRRQLEKSGNVKWQEKTFTPNTEMLGHLGEMIYGHYTGQEVDAGTDTRGHDGGQDFPDGIDAKATVYVGGHLLVETDHTLWPRVGFALVLLDLKQRAGRVLGYATNAMVRGAPIRDFGHGPRFTLGQGNLIGTDAWKGAHTVKR